MAPPPPRPAPLAPPAPAGWVPRSAPTFLVGSEEQRQLLEQFQRRCLHYSEAYHESHKPLCFSAVARQRTHPQKLGRGSADADATLASPMILGVCDGVAQVEDLGFDASELPRELLRSCETIAAQQLLQDEQKWQKKASYLGPTELLREAYAGTASKGSTSVLLAVMDNSTQIHGKLHPMVGIVTLGDCELVMLRRTERQGPLQPVLHTEMQRIDGHGQRPLQLTRLDQVDLNESGAFDAIERGSGIHCTSTHEGDLLVLGSDGVFDNLFVAEVVDICNEYLPAAPSDPAGFVAASEATLSRIADRIVQLAHQKSEVRFGAPWRDTPVGVGGKVDDTSVVVAEVVPWTQARRRAWEKKQPRVHRSCDILFSCSRPPRCSSVDEFVVSDNEGDEGLLNSSFQGNPEDAKGCYIL